MGKMIGVTSARKYYGNNGYQQFILTCLHNVCEKPFFR